MSARATPSVEIFPRPRRIEVTGTGPPAGACPVNERVDATLPEQGFALTVDGEEAHISHRDPHGLRYARGVLDQLIAQAVDGRIAAVEITDSPDFPTRAFMLDISRDRVPTRDTLERFVSLMAAARYNQFQLYMEHTFAYRDHGEVWRSASPMTPDDIVWLDALCAHNGIELVPNQNCFGHMGRWLAHSSYAWRAECPEGIDVAFGIHMPPSVLAPTAENASFALSLFSELLPNFTSRQVNIGCDETFELGRGKSHDECERIGKGRVYTGYVRRIAEPLLAEGRSVQIWADVVRAHPELIGELPPGIIPIVWCYEFPHGDDFFDAIPAPLRALAPEIGIDMETFRGFGPNAAPLVSQGAPFWVAPGTSSWQSLVGRVDNARANLIDAAEVGRSNGCGGIVVTDWGDSGHLQPPSVSFGPLLYGGALAWSLDTNRDLDIGDLLNSIAFDDPSGRLGGALVDLGLQWARTGQAALNSSPLQAALIPSQFHGVFGMADAGSVRSIVESIGASMDSLAASAPRCPDAEIVRAELLCAARLARHGAWRLLKSLGSDGPDAAPDTARLAADLAEAIDEQRAAWLLRSRPGGLEDSLAHLHTTLKEG